MKSRYLSACISLALATAGIAEAKELELETIEVFGQKLPLSGMSLNQEDIIKNRASTNDSARLLEGLPGLSLYGAGGVSSLPAIHGMADDRLRIQVDGMSLTSACANHMNPPLSYIDPANIGSVEVFAGITPVSVGGDSIGGTILVSSLPPEFALAGQTDILKGQLAAFYRSNGDVKGGNATVTIANDWLSMTYTGSYVESDNYSAADDFKSTMNPAQTAGTVKIPDADEVGSSSYKAVNHDLRFGVQHENHLLELKLGLQHIPYQGFPNQRMDMTDNKGELINLSYDGKYQWGSLEAQVYHEKTRHKMNFLDEKLQKMNPAGLRMDTRGKTSGADIKADIKLSEQDVLRVGIEYQSYTLDDWWDPIGPWLPGPQVGKGMRGDSPFWNINDGERDRFDVYAEWERNWNQQWLSQIGLRSSTISMDAGDVRGYNTMPESIKGGYGNPTDPASNPGAFNAENHHRTDHNLDFTALLSYTPTADMSIEGGYARKVRSPNLYERYAWSTTNTMIMNMVNWSGEANGYVGNLDLDPEVAHTFSVTLDWLDADEQDWGLRITPYYTHVDDYIDAQRCSGGTNYSPCKGSNPTRTTGFVYLQLVNQSARIYGVDVSGHYVLAESEKLGRFSTTGVLNYARGENRDTSDNLYNIMPLNATLAIEHQLGNWSNSFEWQMVDGKDDVSAVRNELETAGYGLLNFRGSYEWARVRVDYGVENILDRFYAHPLSGAYVGEGNVMGGGATWGIPVPGMGVSVFAGLTWTF